jgi:hypothetical protein
MLRAIVAAALLMLIASSCTFQPSGASQGVTINPFAWGSGQQVVEPANDLASGYVNGEPLNVRR